MTKRKFDYHVCKLCSLKPLLAYVLSQHFGPPQRFGEIHVAGWISHPS